MRPFYQKKDEEFSCFYAADMNFPAHLHHAVELVLIQEGAMEVTVQNQTKILRKKEAALIFPEIVHSYLTHGSSRAILCIFSPALIKEYYHLLCRSQPQCPFFSSPALDADLETAFDRMLQYAGKSLPISEAWLNLILAYLMSEAVLLPRDSQYSTDIGYRIISYISNHFQEPLTLNQVARELHSNKYYISRAFSSRLHCNFHEYVNRLRLDYAARLLRETDRSITEIWQEAGFESQKTFNRTFLACYGTTPSKYRGKALPQKHFKTMDSSKTKE